MTSEISNGEFGVSGNDMRNIFANANDVSALLGVSRTKAYQIIRNLNKELANKGFITINGKVLWRYLNERLGL